MYKTLTLLAAVMALSLGAAVAQDNSNTPPANPPASASGNNGGTWADKHPVRAADNQQMRQDVKDGTLTKKQAARDRRMERRMAAKHGGHLTKTQQQKLQNRIARQQARDAAKKQ